MVCVEHSSDMLSGGNPVATFFESVVAFYAAFLERHFQVRSSRRANGIWVPYQPLWEEPGLLEFWVGTDGYLIGRRAESGAVMKIDPQRIAIPERPIAKSTMDLSVAGATLQFQEFDSPVSELSLYLSLGGAEVSMGTPRFWDPVCICDVTFENGPTRISWRELRVYKDAHPAALHQSVVPTVVFEELARIGSDPDNDARAFVLPRRSKDLFVDRLSSLRKSIDGLRRMLATNADGLEAAFARFLFDNPNLLCPTATRSWRERPLLGREGETRYVPDIVFQEVGGRFLFIEVEQPSDQMETRSGRPGHKSTDGAYQLSQWEELISENPLGQKHYPGVHGKICRFLLVCGRGSPSRESRGTFAHQVVTFDEVVDVAECMYRNLSSGGASIPSKNGGS